MENIEKAICPLCGEPMKLRQINNTYIYVCEACPFK